MLTIVVLISCLVICSEGRPRDRRYRRDEDVGGVVYAPCKDTYSQCPEWKKSGMCDMPQYKDYMPLVCTDTCGFCKDVIQEEAATTSSTSSQLAEPAESSTSTSSLTSTSTSIDEPQPADSKQVIPVISSSASADSAPVLDDYQVQLQKYYENIDQQQKAYQASVQQYAQSSSTAATPATETTETGAVSAAIPDTGNSATSAAFPTTTDALAAPVYSQPAAVPVAYAAYPGYGAATDPTAKSAATDPAAAAASSYPAASAYQPYGAQPSTTYPESPESPGGSSSSTSVSSGSSSSSSSQSSSGSSTSTSIGNLNSSNETEATAGNVSSASGASILPSKVAPETPSLPALPPLLVLPPISDSLLVDDSTRLTNTTPVSEDNKETAGTAEEKPKVELQQAADAKPYAPELEEASKVEAPAKENPKEETKEVTKEVEKEEESAKIKHKTHAKSVPVADRKPVTEDQATNEMTRSVSKHLSHLLHGQHKLEGGNEDDESDGKIVKAFSSDSGKLQVSKGEVKSKKKSADVDVKETKDVKDAKEVKEAKEAKEVKDTKDEPKEVKEEIKQESKHQHKSSHTKHEKKKSSVDEDAVFKHDEKSGSVSGNNAKIEGETASVESAPLNDANLEENFEDLNYITDFNPDDFDMDLTDISHKDLLDKNADKRDAVLSPKEQRDAVVLPKDHPLYKHVSHTGVQKARSQITAPTIIDATEHGAGNAIRAPSNHWVDNTRRHDINSMKTSQSSHSEIKAEEEEMDKPEEEEAGEEEEEEEEEDPEEGSSAVVKDSIEKADKEEKVTTEKKTVVKTQAKQLKGKAIEKKSNSGKSTKGKPVGNKKSKVDEVKKTVATVAKKVPDTKVVAAVQEIPKTKVETEVATKKSTTTADDGELSVTEISGDGSADDSAADLSGDAPERSSITTGSGKEDMTATATETSDEEDEGEDDVDDDEETASAHARHNNVQLNGDPEKVDLRPKKTNAQPDLNDFPADKDENKSFSEDDDEPKEDVSAVKDKDADAGGDAGKGEEGELDDLKIEELLSEDDGKGKKAAAKPAAKAAGKGKAKAIQSSKKKTGKTEKAKEVLKEGYKLLNDCRGILKKICEARKASKLKHKLSVFTNSTEGVKGRPEFAAIPNDKAPLDQLQIPKNMPQVEDEKATAIAPNWTALQPTAQDIGRLMGNKSQSSPDLDSSPGQHLSWKAKAPESNSPDSQDSSQSSESSPISPNSSGSESSVLDSSKAQSSDSDSSDSDSSESDDSAPDSSVTNSSDSSKLNSSEQESTESDSSAASSSESNSSESESSTSVSSALNSSEPNSSESEATTPNPSAPSSSKPESSDEWFSPIASAPESSTSETSANEMTSTGLTESQAAVIDSSAPGTSDSKLASAEVLAPQPSNSKPPAKVLELSGKISFVLSQNFNALYEKKDSPNYQMLSGNVKKDIEKMVKGTTVRDVNFSEVSVEGNPRQSGKTKVSFNIDASSDEWMKRLLKLVDGGDIDGLKVIKGSLEIEEE